MEKSCKYIVVQLEKGFVHTVISIYEKYWAFTSDLDSVEGFCVNRIDYKQCASKRSREGMSVNWKRVYREEQIWTRI